MVNYHYCFICSKDIYISCYLNNLNKIYINIYIIHGYGQARIYVRQPLNSKKKLSFYKIRITIYKKLN